MKPPFVWPIRLKAFVPRLFESESFYLAARLLRRREAGEHSQLDMDATVAATTKALGYPTIRYKLVTRPPEYLLLIERTSFRDHQAQLYNELAKALEREGNFVVRYFYDIDPRVCCDEAGSNCLSLVELHGKFASHRLLIFGDGARLLDPITGRLLPWSNIFENWSDRALLTPVPLALWGFREVTLANRFYVLPAALEGLLTLATNFEAPPEIDVRLWGTRDTDRPPALDAEPAEVVTSLRNYLGEPVFQWLCACAIYPELHWDLTLYIGALPVMGSNLITEEALLHLAHLPWFRAGTLPDELRLLLLQRLDSEKERVVRLAIIELLERDLPPSETYAADMHQLNLVVQRWLSRRDRKRRREMLRTLQNVPRQQILRDYTLVRSMESPSTSALNVHLPARLRSVFYRSGIPAFGLRTGARLMLTLLLITAGFATHKYGHQIIFPPSATHQEVRVGVFMSLTGSTANFGISSVNGIKMAADEANAQGGINGKQIELLVQDDRSDAAEAATIVTKFVTQDGVQAILGEVASSRSIAAAPIAQYAKIPMLSPASTHPAVTQKGDYIFRACFTDSEQGQAIAMFVANNLKLKRGALLIDIKNDYSVNLGKSISDTFKSMGGEIIIEQVYQESDSDFNGQLASIKVAKPDVIFVPGYYTEAGLIAQQARKQGITVPLVGGDGWDSPLLYEIGGAALEGSFYSSHFTPYDPDPNVQKFVNNYLKLYGRMPDVFDALGYDAAFLMFDAIKRANSTDGTDIRDALAKTSAFHGLTGEIKEFSAGRDPLKPILILRIESGKAQLAERVWVR